MNRIIFDAVIKIAKEQLDTDIKPWPMKQKWEFIKEHHEIYAPFFGSLHTMEEYPEPLTEPYYLPIKNLCPDCEINKIKIQRFMDNKPNKYDNTITLTLRQDWAGVGWHIHDVGFGTYVPFSGDDSSNTSKTGEEE